MVVKKDKLSLLRYVSIRDAMYNLTTVSTAVSYIERLLRDEVLRVLITERNFFPFTYLY